MARIKKKKEKNIWSSFCYYHVDIWDSYFKFFSVNTRH